MNLVLYDTQSDYYQQSLSLRQAVLRKPLGLDLFTQDLSVEVDYWHFGLVENKQLVACLIIVPKTPKHGILKQMAVMPSMQGQHLGQQLIQDVEQVALAKGIESMALSAREHAIGFYQKLGYRPVGELYLEVTIPHQLMTKSLNG